MKGSTQASRSVTNTFDNFAQAANSERPFTVAHDENGKRSFGFTESGDVVSTKRRDGEDVASVNFRLMAALTAMGVI